MPGYNAIGLQCIFGVFGYCFLPFMRNGINGCTTFIMIRIQVMAAGFSWVGVPSFVCIRSMLSEVLHVLFIESKYLSRKGEHCQAIDGAVTKKAPPCCKQSECAKN